MGKKSLLDKVPLVSYSRGEEIANSLSHAAGAVFSVLVLVLCVVKAARSGDKMAITAAVIYGISILVLYTASTLYHSFPDGKVKKILRILDHSMIFLLIAGSVTPFAMVSIYALSPTRGWIMFIIAWTGLIVGILATVIDFEKSKVLDMILYIGLGWSMILVTFPLMKYIPRTPLYLMFFGGFLYTAGVIFYGIGKKKKYMHFVFHLFVMLGSAAHFWCIFKYVLDIGRDISM